MAVSSSTGGAEAVVTAVSVRRRPLDLTHPDAAVAWAVVAGGHDETVG
jgi:hypothetical protein